MSASGTRAAVQQPRAGTSSPIFNRSFSAAADYATQGALGLAVAAGLMLAWRAHRIATVCRVTTAAELARNTDDARR